VIALVSKLVKTITLKSVLLLSLAGILAIAALLSFEHRAEIFGSITTPKQRPVNEVGHEFVIGDDTKARIRDIIKTDQTYNGIAILSADIRLNTRRVIYVYDPTASKAKMAHLLNTSRLPLFTRNEDNNRQIVKLINGEFFCAPYATTQVAQMAPDQIGSNVTICRVSIPPYYGFFSGFVALALRVDPSIEQQSRIKEMLENLATEVYFRDVIPTHKKTTFGAP
jgi:hypothetical protein